MQANGIHVEPLFSSPGNPHNITALLETIVKLKQDVKLCQQEKNAAIEQLNCLISLIKRSWTGDNNASLHLANIVGLPPPEFDYRASHLTNTPVPPDKSRDLSRYLQKAHDDDATNTARVVMLWERLSLKLLDRNYAEIQEEIRERQMLYIQNRQLYMDEVLHHHQVDMSKTPTRKNSKTYEEVDRRFINAYGKFDKGVMTDRNNVRINSNKGSPRTRQQGGMNQRAKSAPNRTRASKNVMNGSNIKMKDLFVPNQTGEPQIPFTDAKGLHIVNSGVRYNKERLDYDDPQRYGQTNLFNLDAIFGQDTENRKPQRPVSAFVPRGQLSKTRPQSAFITQKNERPMKYETTRPVSGKKTSKHRLKSASEGNIGQKTFIAIPLVPEYNECQYVNEDDENNRNDESDKDNTDVHDVDYDSDLDLEAYNKPPMKVRVDSAQKRPAHVDKFVKELQTMEAMEKDFKKSALQLQKKLGINFNGMVA